MTNATPDRRHRTTAGTRLRLVVRLLALAGLLAVPAGLGWLRASGQTFPTPSAWTGDGLRAWVNAVTPMPGTSVGATVAAVGVGLLLAWAAVEVVGVLFLSTGRRSALGVNSVVQIGLAVALLVVANVISFDTFRRYDLTRDQQFTLPPDLVAELKALRADSPTTVVVLQLKKSGPFGGEPDAYDAAAEAVVVEKVRDLVAQLREFGPQFRVTILDRKQEIDFDKALNSVADARPGLAEAVLAAPESSLFFYADEKVRSMPRTDADRLVVAGVGPRPAVVPDPADPGRALVYPATVTRMGFSEFYQLDKTASRAATADERAGAGAVAGGAAFAPAIGGGGNLVLLPRGPEAFVRKILSIEERKPRIGLAVIHPLLTTRDTAEEYSAAGLRVALERNGFDVTDVILKKWSRGGPPTPDVTTYEETDLARAEARYNLLALLTADREQAVKILSELVAKADKALAAADAGPPADRAKRLAEAGAVLQQFVRTRLAAEADIRTVRARVAEQADVFRAELADFAAKAETAGGQYRDRLRNERAVENRRVTDIKAKLSAYTADCDALIVPRLTVVDITRGDGGTIPSSLFNLTADQAEVVREFLKQGKPVLFAVGPQISDGRPGGEAPDDIERLLPQLGIVPGRQTILTDDEVTAMAEQVGQTFGASTVRAALSFDRPEPAGKSPNPVAAALRVTGRAAGKPLDIRQGGFRPLYASDALLARSAFAPEFLFTSAASFNEERPVPADDYQPKFDPAKPDDPRRGTRDEERRGPFPVGVAAEVTVPAAWFDAPGVPAGHTPLAGVVGPQLPAVWKLGTHDVTAAAALALPFDIGLTAGLATATAATLPRPAVRVVALGHGGLFTGKTLDPGHEALLVDSLNWQLRRDARLPQSSDTVWQFPRAHLTPREADLWRWGTLVYLPLAVAAFGVAVLMVRRLR